jgi:hypothetical protein
LIDTPVEGSWADDMERIDQQGSDFEIRADNFADLVLEKLEQGVILALAMQYECDMKNWILA